MSSGLTIFIIGGYGTFGGRIVELLEDEPSLRLIVAGRSLEKATRFCKRRAPTHALLLPAAFNRDSDVASQLAAFKIDILVDASGPFQAYGAGRYRVIEACLARKINYLDLADGSDFVAGVDAYDEVARAAGLFVLSGVSSFPVLTAAVVRHLSKGMTRVDTIRGGIAPSPFAGVGQNVIRAIAGYAGQKIMLRRDSKSVAAYPLTEQIRFTIRPPGYLPLRSTLFSLVDVPDLRALTHLWPEAKSIWMGAGPVPEILHRVLIALAWLVREGRLPELTPFAPLMHFAMKYLRWGEHRGGMFVEVAGADVSGVSSTRIWHLLAEGNDGPFIPAMAVEALVRKAMQGHMPASGARACLRDLELSDYEKLFAKRTIYTGIREETSHRPACLYAKILGPAWESLPAEIQEMHHGTVFATGQAKVERGEGWLSRLAGAVAGFPKASTLTPVDVHFTVSGDEETWTRKFGDETFSSRQFAGRGRSEGLLCERFGALTFAMALVVRDEGLSFVLRRWDIFGLPLPIWLGPRSNTSEKVEDGLFCFHVEISHPLTGLIARYKGRLKPSSRRLKGTFAPSVSAP
jgi:hypothetical protein